jgi:hypothetical protein
MTGWNRNATKRDKTEVIGQARKDRLNNKERLQRKIF